MNKVTVVLDTNVFLVSSAKHYKYHWIFKEILTGNIRLLVSTEILLEYQEQITYRYGLASTNATLDFLLLLPNVVNVIPYFNWQLIVQDQDDNKFVDVAIAGNADILVSNDKVFRNLKDIDFPVIKTMTAEQFQDFYQSI